MLTALTALSSLHVAVSPLLLALSCLYHLSIPSHEHLDALLRPPRCARQAKADLRSGSGEASQGGSRQTAARKRLATGPQPSPQSGATGDSTGSPSPALDSSLSGTQLPSTRLKTSHHARLAGGAPSMAQTILQKAKSLVSSGGQAHHTVLQSLPPEQFSSLIDSLRKVSDDFQGRLAIASKELEGLQVRSDSCFCT